MRCDQQRAVQDWLVVKATRGNGREQPIAVCQRVPNESRPGQDVPPCHLSCAGAARDDMPRFANREAPTKKPSGSSIDPAFSTRERAKKKRITETTGYT
ncbi:hypothetical protein GQ55_9G043400 [Panicum hallii var. hallii]|uniref:Uncharacterized protein n=1 Tax=Panicum hallii var. hallii TaxID=1504633 RepID=A0A2T7BZM4_9POAL|nr:hypothetical protein GQ55_9G043400 [Panicum hallii var. hallii]